MVAPESPQPVVSKDRGMTALVLQAGIHDGVEAERYHTDPAPEPSLSAGIAHRLISRSPLHAREAHPRLNPLHAEDHAGHLDFGTAAHSLLLDGMDVCEIIDADSWRTKAAQEQRDSAREAGLVPLLQKDWERMCVLVDAVKAQTAALDVHPRPLTDGKPEQTLVWQEDGVWCRARIDWLHDAGDVIDDLKSTATSANPFLWARNRLFADGKDIQAVHYLKGLQILTGVEAAWRFIVVEVDPPHALSVISLAPSALELAERKRARALELWKRCLESDTWPGYPTEVAYAEAPPWEAERFLEQHYEEEQVAA
jgi:hypothetical protein